jgi:hypothetical protein
MNSITFAIGSASQFSMTVDLPELLVGATTTVEVTALDTYGNLDQGFTGTVRVVFTAATVTTADIALIAGVGQHQYSQTVPGLVTVSLQDIAATGLSATATTVVTFKHGLYTNISITSHEFVLIVPTLIVEILLLLKLTVTIYVFIRPFDFCSYCLHNFLDC